MIPVAWERQLYHMGHKAEAEATRAMRLALESSFAPGDGEVLARCLKARNEAIASTTQSDRDAAERGRRKWVEAWTHAVAWVGMVTK